MDIRKGYEDYKLFCENVFDPVTRNKLPIRLSLKDQERAIKALTALVYYE